MAKPASGTALDTGNALYTNLLSVWALLEGTGTTSADSKGTNTATLNAGTGTGSWQTVSAGPIWRTGSATTGQPIALSAFTLATVGVTSWSIAWGSKQLNNDDNGMMLGKPSTNTDYVWQRGANYLRWTDAANNQDFTSVTSFTAYHDYLLVADFIPAVSSFLHLYVDGVEVTGSPSGSKTLGPWLIDTLANGFAASALSFIGDLHYVYVWDGRALTAGNAVTLAANPYSIFQASAGTTVVLIRS